MQHPVSIVTGAGSGIGRSIARMLAEKGHHVVLVGRTEQKLAEASDELRAIGPGDVMIVPADVADSEHASAVVDQTIERFGRVDNLVNCAGVAPMMPIERTTEETLERHPQLLRESRRRGNPGAAQQFLGEGRSAAQGDAPRRGGQGGRRLHRGPATGRSGQVHLPAIRLNVSADDPSRARCRAWSRAP